MTTTCQGNPHVLSSKFPKSKIRGCRRRETGIKKMTNMIIFFIGVFGEIRSNEYGLG